MAGRSSTRHMREVQGRDSQEYTAPDFDEYNDFTAKGVTPRQAGAEPSYTLPDADKDGDPD